MQPIEVMKRNYFRVDYINQDIYFKVDSTYVHVRIKPGYYDLPSLRTALIVSCEVECMRNSIYQPSLLIELNLIQSEEQDWIRYFTYSNRVQHLSGSFVDSIKHSRLERIHFDYKYTSSYYSTRTDFTYDKLPVHISNSNTTQAYKRNEPLSRPVSIGECIKSTSSTSIAIDTNAIKQLLHTQEPVVVNAWHLCAASTDAAITVHTDREPTVLPREENSDIGYGILIVLVVLLVLIVLMIQ